MKGFLFNIAFLAIIASAFAKPPEFVQYRKECETEIGITKPPRHGDIDDPQAKCFHACMMKKMGLLVDGKIDLEKKLELLSERMPDMDDSTKEKITECVDNANAESDECEVAYAMRKCMKENNVLPHRGRGPPKRH